MGTIPTSPTPQLLKDTSPAVTTGLDDREFYPHLGRTQPKPVGKRSAQRSDDFGTIPALREPYKPDKKI